MANNAITRLRKTDYIPFIDTKTTGDTSEWKRITKSTIFSLNPNPQTEDFDYISTETPVTEVKNYLPELPQETATYEGDPIYDFIFDKFFNLPKGSECVVPVLLCFGGSDKRAWKADATLVLGELNTVDGKISFTIKLGGDIQRGTYSITEGAPTFSVASV